MRELQRRLVASALLAVVGGGVACALRPAVGTAAAASPAPEPQTSPASPATFAEGCFGLDAYVATRVREQLLRRRLELEGTLALSCSARVIALNEASGSFIAEADALLTPAGSEAPRLWRAARAGLVLTDRRFPVLERMADGVADAVAQAIAAHPEGMPPPAAPRHLDDGRRLLRVALVASRALGKSCDDWRTFIYEVGLTAPLSALVRLEVGDCARIQETDIHALRGVLAQLADSLDTSHDLTVFLASRHFGAAESREGPDCLGRRADPPPPADSKKDRPADAAPIVIGQAPLLGSPPYVAMWGPGLGSDETTPELLAWASHLFLHELGHLVGLGHVAADGDIMQTTLERGATPTVTAEAFRQGLERWFVHPLGLPTVLFAGDSHYAEARAALVQAVAIPASCPLERLSALMLRRSKVAQELAGDKAGRTAVKTAWLAGDLTFLHRRDEALRLLGAAVAAQPNSEVLTTTLRQIEGGQGEAQELDAEAR